MLCASVLVYYFISNAEWDGTSFCFLERRNITAGGSNRCLKGDPSK